MAIWNNKFDRVNGETRQCTKCNTSFHTMKPKWICRLCANANQKIICAKQREKIGKKDNYPFSTATNEAGKRFSKIRAELNRVWKTKDRNLIREHYAKQLKEAEELGILKWIYDVRTADFYKEKVMKSRSKITTDLPDTKHFSGYE